jgi:hypothetical protein
VRIIGMAPLNATIYECEQLRCNLCGEIFAAPRPLAWWTRIMTRQPSAWWLLSNLARGSHFIACRGCSTLLGIPLPATTQWHLVKRAADLFAPVATQS